MMAEFNNDGTGTDKSALEGFQRTTFRLLKVSEGAGGDTLSQFPIHTLKATRPTLAY